MASEVGDLSEFANWALENSVWDGERVDWRDASDCYRKVQSRIANLLLSDSFEKLTLQFAWVGSEDRAAVAQEIQQMANGQAVQIGVRKSASHFWKKHKQEILYQNNLKNRFLPTLSPKERNVLRDPLAASASQQIFSLHSRLALGQCRSLQTQKFARLPCQIPDSSDHSGIIGGAIVGVVATVAIIAVCSSGAAAGVAAAGGKALDRLNDQLDRPKTSKKNLAPKPSRSELAFNEKGVEIDGKFASYTDLLQNKPLDVPSAVDASPDRVDPPKKNWISNLVESAQNEIRNSPLLSQGFPIPKLNPSSRFSTSNPTPNSSKPHLRIGGINGMNTNWENANSHASYIASFAPDQSIDWIHNQTHGPVIDFAEIFTLNYWGFSPNTSKGLQENWAAFHQDNKDRPDAKYLQFCHSQGAIHVRNGLVDSPKEIRDRVIVVAIAPGAVVPKEICHQSFNYASKKDIVHFGEMFFTGSLEANEHKAGKLLDSVLERRGELILLDPHPDASGIDHDFQSPTFRDVIQNQINEYLNGQIE